MSGIQTTTSGADAPPAAPAAGHYTAGQLYAYACDGGDAPAIAGHLEACAECRRWVAEFGKARARCAEKGPAAVCEDVLARSARRAARSARAALAAAPPPPAAAGAAPAADEYAALSAAARRQIDVAVVQAALDLKPVPEISAGILHEHRVHLPPEQIREIVQRTRRNGDLVFKAASDRELEELLRREFGLQSVTVVRCAGQEPINRWAAESLKDVIWGLRRSRLAVGAPRPVVIGIAGGPTTFHVMNMCGHLLEHDGFDGEVAVDAMVPGAFSLHMGFMSPNWPGFQLANCWENTHHLRETNYGGQFIPPMCNLSHFRHLDAYDRTIRATWDAMTRLDVILTSGAVWDDPHGALQLKLYYPDAEGVRRAHAIVGELLWHPISERGPVRMDPVPMTSLGPEGLERLIELIGQGKRVVAVLGPCGRCNTRKTALVKTLLPQRRPLITDLVIDAFSAEEAAADLLGARRVRAATGRGAG